MLMRSNFSQRNQQVNLTMRYLLRSTVLSLICLLGSTHVQAALSPFGCDGGVTSVYTMSLEPYNGTPIGVNQAVCGTVSDARSATNGTSINTGSFDTDNGVTLGAGAAILDQGSTTSFVQGGAIYDFIPRREDGQSGLGSFNYLARASLLNFMLTGQGSFNTFVRNQASVTISRIDDNGSVLGEVDSQRLIIATTPGFPVDDSMDFGETVQLIAGQRYIITLNGLIDIELVSRFDSDTSSYGQVFYSIALGLSAQVFAPDGWLLEYPGGVRTTLGDYPPFNTPALVPLPPALAVFVLPLAGLIGSRRTARRRH